MIHRWQHYGAVRHAYKQDPFLEWGDDYGTIIARSMDGTYIHTYRTLQ